MKFPRGPVHRIQVTQEAVTRAVRADSRNCWIAESMKAQIPHARNVAVDLATIRYSDPEKGLRYVYITPFSVQRALLAFDEGTPPDPFSFSVRNAHVTRAGTTEQTQARRAKQRALKTALPKKATLVSRGKNGQIPRRVGGKRPPQLRMMRMFGVRAFRGASKQRLDAEIVRAQDKVGA